MQLYMKQQALIRHQALIKHRALIDHTWLVGHDDISRQSINLPDKGAAEMHSIKITNNNLRAMTTGLLYSRPQICYADLLLKGHLGFIRMEGRQPDESGHRSVVSPVLNLNFSRSDSCVRSRMNGFHCADEPVSPWGLRVYNHDHCSN